MTSSLYKLMLVLNNVLFPSSWIKFLTIPLILFFISLLVYKFIKPNQEDNEVGIRKVKTLFQVTLLTLFTYTMIVVTTHIGKTYFKEELDRQYVVQQLTKVSNNSIVYLNHKKYNKPIELTKTLLSVKHVSSHHSYKKSKALDIEVNLNLDQILYFKLYQDTKIMEEYWVYLLNKKEDKYIYIGRLHTTIFMNQQELSLYQQSHFEKEEQNKIKEEKSDNWKVTLVIGILFFGMFILIYDGVFRQNHFDIKVKRRYWVSFHLVFTLFLLLLFKDFLHNKFFLIIMLFIILLILNNIFRPLYCSNCKKIKKQ